MHNNSKSRVCAECKHWKCCDIPESSHMEDEIGSCRMTGEIVYGDDEFAENCDDFKSGKNNVKKRR